MVLVYRVEPFEPAGDYKTVYDALSYALDLGYNRTSWTDRFGGLNGYRAWIKTLEIGQAGRFGHGYNAAVWAENRRYAVGFLLEAKQKLHADLHPLFDEAVTQYETVASSLRDVSEAYPFMENDNSTVSVDDRAMKAIEMLRRAYLAEETGLQFIDELVKRIPSCGTTELS